MHRFRSILVSVGRDPAPESVLVHAARLAERDGASLTLVSVVEDLPWYTRLVRSAATELHALLVQHSAEALERLAGPLRGRGVAVVTHVIEGRASVETVRQVLRGGHDLVIKEADPNARVAFSSADMQLLRNCPCAFLLIKPGHGDAAFRRILAPVDPAPSLDPEDPLGALGLQSELEGKDPALDRKILALATSFAADAGELHVLHAWSVPGEGLLRGETLLSRAQVDRYVEDVRAEARKALDRLVEPFPAEPGRRSVHLLKGDAADCIAEFAEKEKIDLIVMGTVARTGLSAILMGNTAETILQRVGCSVLAVKPDGFVSPVVLDKESPPPLPVAPAEGG